MSPAQRADWASGESSGLHTFVYTPGVERNRLGASDLSVSRLGLGGNNFGMRLDLAQTRVVVDAALDAGINHIDSADIYGNRGDSERFLGEVLKGRRDRVVLATKFGMDMAGANGEDGGARGSAAYVRRAVEASLERLQMDHIDLYYYHRPDGVTPLGETLAALNDLVIEGKVRAIACSNLSADQLREAVAYTTSTGSAPVAALQNQYSLLDRSVEEEILPLCVEHNVAFIPFFPLASGLLTGKYRRGEPPPVGTRLAARPDALTDAAFEKVNALEEFARARGRSLLELAIAGLASQPGVASVIAGATKPEQIKANAAAAEWQLTTHDLEELSRIR